METLSETNTSTPESVDDNYFPAEYTGQWVGRSVLDKVRPPKHKPGWRMERRFNESAAAEAPTEETVTETVAGEAPAEALVEETPVLATESAPTETAPKVRRRRSERYAESDGNSSGLRVLTEEAEFDKELDAVAAESDRILEESEAAEKEKDPGADLGSAHLSFSSFREREFEPRRDDETDEEFAKRQDYREEHKIMAAFLAQEVGGAEAAKEALEKDFFVKRRQRREFMEAIAKLSPDEYAERINGILDLQATRGAQLMTVRQADNIWKTAHSEAYAPTEEISEPDEETEEVAEPIEEVEEPVEKAEAPVEDVERPVARVELEPEKPVTLAPYRERKQARRFRFFSSPLPKDFYGKPRPEGGFFPKSKTA